MAEVRVRDAGVTGSWEAVLRIFWFKILFIDGES